MAGQTIAEVRFYICIPSMVVFIPHVKVPPPAKKSRKKAATTKASTAEANTAGTQITSGQSATVGVRCVLLHLSTV